MLLLSDLLPGHRFTSGKRYGIRTIQSYVIGWSQWCHQMVEAIPVDVTTETTISIAIDYGAGIGCLFDGSRTYDVTHTYRIV